MLNNEVTSFTFGLLIPVAAIFIPLSYLSQGLSDSSGRFQQAAYHAATASSSLREARALNTAMLVAGKRPALRCNGLGKLSLRGAAGALRQFYSAVNMLGSRF